MSQLRALNESTRRFRRNVILGIIAWTIAVTGAVWALTEHIVSLQKRTVAAEAEVVKADSASIACSAEVDNLRRELQKERDDGAYRVRALDQYILELSDGTEMKKRLSDIGELRDALHRKCRCAMVEDETEH
jgi:hypothetical protein